MQEADGGEMAARIERGRFGQLAEQGSLAIVDNRRHGDLGNREKIARAGGRPWKTAAREPQLLPGAADLLRSIPDGRWCVVTSGTRLLATGRLRVANLPTPGIMVSADDVTKGKPDPEPYLKGAKLLGTKPEECLVIEDAPAGVRAAHAGKMKVIAITSTFPKAELKEADALVRSLDQIEVTQDQAADGKAKLLIKVRS